MTEFRREALIWCCTILKEILENDGHLDEVGVLLKQKADEYNMDDETRDFAKDMFNDIGEFAEVIYQGYLDLSNDEG